MWACPIGLTNMLLFTRYTFNFFGQIVKVSGSMSTNFSLAPDKESYAEL